MLIYPGWVTDIAGIALVGLALLWKQMMTKKQPA